MAAVVVAAAAAGHRYADKEWKPSLTVKDVLVGIQVWWPSPVAAAGVCGQRGSGAPVAAASLMARARRAAAPQMLLTEPNAGSVANNAAYEFVNKRGVAEYDALVRRDAATPLRRAGFTD